MKRRNFFATAAAGAALPMAAEGQNKKPATLALHFFYLRNGADNQRQRLSDFLAGQMMPAAKRNGVETVGLFGASVAADAPFIMVLTSHASLEAWEAFGERMEKDEAWRQERLKFVAMPGLPYQRSEVRLLKAFNGFPGIEVPPQDTKRPGRLFELRTYESNTPFSLAKKIGMFENGEIEIFRKTGLNPIFFGRTIAGPKMPNLTYMLSFDSMAAREANWRAFVTSDAWKKLSQTPGLSDAELVCNITTMFLSPLNGSSIR